MPIRQGSKIETMKILLEDQFLIGFHLVVILRILFICTKRKLNVFSSQILSESLSRRSPASI